MDTAPSGFEGQPSVGLDISLAPGFRALLYPLELGIPVLAAAGPLHRQAVLEFIIDSPWHIPRHRLSELAVIHTGQGLKGINAGAEFIHPHIVFRPCQAMLQARKEDGNLVRLHRRVLRNQLVAAVFIVQIQEMMLLAEHFATLVEFADTHTHVILFGIVGDVD